MWETDISMLWLATESLLFSFRELDCEGAGTDTILGGGCMDAAATRSSMNANCGLCAANCFFNLLKWKQALKIISTQSIIYVQ